MNELKVPSNDETSFPARKRRWVLGWAPLFIYTLLIFQGALSTDLGPFAEFFLKIGDKWLHSLEFFCLSFLAWNAFRRAKLPGIRRPLLRNVIVYGFAIGMLSELAQNLIPSRSAEVLDWVADALGVLLSVFFLQFLRPYEIRKSESL